MNQTPISKSQTPIWMNQTPISKNQTPISKSQRPSSKSQTPISKGQTPISRNRPSASESLMKSALIFRAERKTQSVVSRVARIGLLDLPDDVIEMIIFQVRAMVRAEAQVIKATKWNYVTLAIQGSSRHDYVANYRPPVPILSSVQALSVVNRRLHKLCQSSLWGHLQFPTSLPCDLLNWTQNLMPKHGEFVRSMTLLASIGWITPPLQSDTYKLDNMIVLKSRDIVNDRGVSDPSTGAFRLSCYEKKRQAISPERATKLLVHCPHLRTFKMIFPPEWATRSPSDLLVLEARLLSLISELTGLRDLSFDGPIALSENFVVDILEHLPLLDTFSASVAAKSPPEEAGYSLGRALSRLKNLKQLRIHGSNLINQSWLDHDWPKCLTNLTIPFNKDIPIPELKHFITSLAPDLTHLDLKFYLRTPTSTYSSIDPPDATPECYFDLPKLIELVICSRPDHHLITAFQKCQQIRKILHLELSAQEWASFSNLTCSSAWPQLEFIEICCPDIYDPADWKIVMGQEKLRKFCQKSAICLQVKSFDYID